MLGRRNGMIALEEHVSNPQQQFHLWQILEHRQKTITPSSFLCSGLRPGLLTARSSRPAKTAHGDRSRDDGK
jgi:hypothetical protein